MDAWGDWPVAMAGARYGNDAAACVWLWLWLWLWLCAKDELAEASLAAGAAGLPPASALGTYERLRAAGAAGASTPAPEVVEAPNERAAEGAVCIANQSRTSKPEEPLEEEATKLAAAGGAAVMGAGRGSVLVDGGCEEEEGCC